MYEEWIEGEGKVVSFLSLLNFLSFFCLGFRKWFWREQQIWWRHYMECLITIRYNILSALIHQSMKFFSHPGHFEMFSSKTSKWLGVSSWKHLKTIIQGCDQFIRLAVLLQNFCGCFPPLMPMNICQSYMSLAWNGGLVSTCQDKDVIVNSYNF